MTNLNLLIINDRGISGGGTENRIRILIDELLQINSVDKIFVIQRFGENYSSERLKIITARSTMHSLILTAQNMIKSKINIVQVHNLASLTPLSLLITKLFRKPVIFFAHDYWPICNYKNFINPLKAASDKLCDAPLGRNCRRCISWKGKIKQLVWNKIINLANIGVASGETVRKVYENNNLLKNKWVEITPWIALDKFAYSDDYSQRENILFVGSLIEFKGAWVLAKALKYIKKEFPDIKTVFIGDQQAEDKKNIENIGLKDGTSDNMIFLGKQSWDEIKKEHDKAIVYVCSTVCMETFGLNWAEAMASGVPIVASRIGSLPDFLENRAILVEPRNAEELGIAIIKLLKDKKLRNELSEKGVKFAEDNFSIHNAVQSLLKIYERLAAR